MPNWIFRSGAIVAAALEAAGMAAGGAARAQDVPQVISPLRVESDHNNVNLVDGRIALDVPVLSVPAAPNLRFDRVQNAAPYVAGRLADTEAGDYPKGNYSVHTGGGSSDSFRCEDFDCESIAGSGSTFLPLARTFRQAGSGAVYHFTVKHVHTTGTHRSLLYYASNVVYPNGEVIAYSYEAATLNGDYLQRTFYRPIGITSNLGFFISLTYQSDDFNGDTDGWNRVAQAAIFASAAPTTPLGRLTYSGTTITDLGGRVYTCVECANGLGVEAEVAAGLLQLPGESAPATQAAAHPTAPVVASVTRDGVGWSYAYGSLHADAYGHWLYDHLTVAGPNGFNAAYDVAQYTISPPSGMTPPSFGNLIVRATDSIGRSTSYHYDEYERVVRIVSPELNEILIAYDARGNINWRTAKAKPGSGLADIIETAEFLTDTCFGVLCYRPSWSRDALGRQTDYAYNEAGQLIEQTDPADADGVRRKTYVSYAISPAGLSRRSVVRVCGAGTTCGTSAEIRTEYDYWGETFLPSSERRIGLSQGAAVTLTTLYGYDNAGRLVSTDGPLAGTDDATYNRYDQYGRRTWEIGARSVNGLRIATRFTYRDSDDKPLSSETGTLPDAASTDLTLLRRTDFAYDGRRNPVRETVSAGATIFSVLQRSFDDRGRLECAAVRMNPAAFASLPASACTPGTAGSDGPDRITRTVYDAAGQRLQLREGVGSADEGTEATWAYNPNGQVATVVDGNGNRAELRYDGHGRQDRWTFPSAARAASFDDSTPATALASAGAVNAADYEEYGYDAAGNRNLLRKRDGRRILYAYDALNRVASKTYPDGGATSVHYGYDITNHQLFARYGSATGEGVTNAYDALGRLLSSSSNMGGVARTLGYAWDAAGNRTRITHPDGFWSATTYDALNRPTYFDANGIGQIYAYYLPHGGFQGVARANGTSSGYAYDALQRLQGRVDYFVGSNNDVYRSWSYNAAGQLSSQYREVIGAGGADPYSWTGHYAVNRAYTTNGLNQYSAAGSATFGYDANGNLTSDGARTYVYDIENRLVSGNGAALVYDPLGRLFQVTGTVAGITSTTRFLYDGDALVAEYDGSNNLTRRHLHWVGADVPMVTFQGADLLTPRYLYTDHQGSIVAATDGAGLPAAINTYDEYGIPGVGNTGRFQYTGQVWLDELGMYYYKARIYSPTLGRLMQTDPIGYAGGINLYGYVGNDPVNMTDPSGLYKCEGNTDQCRQIARYARDVRRASNAASQSTGTRIRSSAASLLSRLSAFIGQDNQENGVIIQAADLGNIELSNNNLDNGNLRIQVDLENISRDRGSTGAGQLVHEATLGAIRISRGPVSRLSDVSRRETEANLAESYTDQFLGMRTNLWAPGMSEAERMRRVRLHARNNCNYFRQTYYAGFGAQTCGQ